MFRAIRLTLSAWAKAVGFPFVLEISCSLIKVEVFHLPSVWAWVYSWAECPVTTGHWDEPFVAWRGSGPGQDRGRGRERRESQDTWAGPQLCTHTSEEFDGIMLHTHTQVLTQEYSLKVQFSFIVSNSD